jgi:hypothetical protein
MSRAGRAVPWRSRSAVFPHVFAHGQALSSFCVRQWLVMGAVIEKRLRRVKDRGESPAIRISLTFVRGTLYDER